ncbi:helix-turn-helix domain-containing protein [Natronomonas salina]|uniref:helix-turn-helix domain-containing protein n=1 Tax=Natronomonas salina TaxID=1710540 RepID=UPI0015B75254|nr:helix-turn-helix domain-containing protein [Natronomonas salina]QLD87572.1 helix-turn-helix domain-containing protein [Natronomonas salina]
MKSMRCTLRFEESAMHPVHRRIAEDDAFVRDQLLFGHRSEAGPDTMLFYAEGDCEAFADALAATDRIVDHEVRPLDESSCYAYVREDMSEFDVRLQEAFEGPGLLVVPPVEFRSDGTARLTVVGEPAALQAALEDVPAEASVDVERIGEYDGSPPGTGADLTDRQREAAAAALEVGYYDVPRSGSLEAVADELGCAPGTASEHLRKAERAALAAAVDPEP